MDSSIDPEKFSAMIEENDGESTVPDTQINPVTIMTSVPSFTPVDDNQQNALETLNMNVLEPQPSETALSLSLNADMFVSTLSTVIDPQTSSNVHMDNRSIAAWVELTTTEVTSSPIERSPSLPSTLFEPIIDRNRRDSNVSTVCDQQQSIISDTLTAQQLSHSNDIQRSLSVPINDQNYHDNNNNNDNNDNNELIFQVNDDDDDEEDISTQFLPVPDSEDSEVDKKLSSVDEKQVKFENRSPTTRESPKKSSNVSFHESVSFETPHKPFLTHRRRHNLWNKNKPPSFQRSHSYMTTLHPPSLHSQILRKQFKTALSMPTGASSSLDNATRQSSDLSDSVFLSTPNTNSSSLQSASHLNRHNRFLAIPSSASLISSDRNASIISDASGRSGIESTNLETSIDDEKSPEFLRQQGNNSTSPSTTPSTQSLPSSSDDDMNNFNKKMNNLEIGQGKRKASTDKRRDVLKQLMWLLEKKTTIYARYNLGDGNLASPTKQHQQQHHHKKSTPSPFVEVI
jgi:hypothetical protein